MIVPPHTPAARTIICESSTRWQLAMFRFAKHWTPRDREPVIESVEPQWMSPSRIAALVRSPHPSVVLWDTALWETGNHEQPKLFSRIAALNEGSRSVAQFAVGESAKTSDPASPWMAELGICGFIRHPEQLLQWRQFFVGHFATAAMDLN